MPAPKKPRPSRHSSHHSIPTAPWLRNCWHATPLVAASTLNYGIPGFAGMIESSMQMGTLERRLADAIRAYEPRIRSETLRVRARGARGEGANAQLVFEIEGELWAQPMPQQLFLETAIELETRLAVVTEVKGTR